MIGVLDRLTRSIENPQVPLSQYMDYEGSVRVTDAGVSVNSTTALRHTPFWRGVNLLAGDTAKLPLYVYKRAGKGKERAKDHPAFKLLRRKPNSEMTARTFKKTLTAHAIMHGNGYAWINRSGVGARPMEMIPLPPDRTYPVRENGQLLFVTAIGGTMENPASTLRKLLPQNVLHIKGLSYDGLCGYSLLDVGADAIGQGLALSKYGSRFFKNSARPSVVIEHPGSISEPAAKRLRESWDRIYAGVENSHRTAILEEGMKLNAFSTNARDSQLDEAKKFDLVTIANLLGVPPHKVGGEGRTSYNSLEQENQSYLDDGLDPWLVEWEEECFDKLLTEQEKAAETHVVEFLRQALIRADMAARSTYYHNALLDGWISRDEVRDKENMNPMPNGDGESFFIPLNVKTTGDDDEADAVADVQQTALNGAQIASMVAIVEQVTAGIVPKPSAKAMIKASFPLMSQADIDAIVDPIEIKEPEPPVMPPGPDIQGSVVGDTKTPAEEPADRAARLSLLTESLGRACRTVGAWARRAAKSPKTFGEWLENAEERNHASVVEALIATSRVCGCDSGDVAGRVFAEIRRVLDDCYSTKSESEFASSVDESMTACETVFAAKLAEEILKGKDNGTQISVD